MLRFLEPIYLFMYLLPGFVQFVESVTVNAILERYKDLQSFLRAHAPSESGPYGISHEVMDTYVKSCGNFIVFDVIKYILSILDIFLIVKC